MYVIKMKPVEFEIMGDSSTVDGDLYLTERNDGGRPELAGFMFGIERARRFNTKKEAEELIRLRKKAYRENGDRFHSPVEVVNIG